MIFNKKTNTDTKGYTKVLVPSKEETDRRDYVTVLQDRNLKLTGFDIVFSNIDIFTIHL